MLGIIADTFLLTCLQEGVKHQSYLIPPVKLEPISPILAHGIKGLRPWSCFGRAVSWILSSRKTKVRTPI